MSDILDSNEIGLPIIDREAVSRPHHFSAEDQIEDQID